MEIRVPYGSSDAAWENPHHLRPYFVNSMQVFSQAFWWRDRDANYRGDWYPEKVSLVIGEDVGERVNWDLDVLWKMVQRERNIVAEMRCEMRAVKPARVFEKGIKPKSGDMMGEVEMVRGRVT